MTLGEMIIEARLQRRKQLDAQLLALMQGREPEDREQFYRWVEEVERVRAELEAMEKLQ